MTSALEQAIDREQAQDAAAATQALVNARELYRQILNRCVEPQAGDAREMIGLMSLLKLAPGDVHADAEAVTKLIGLDLKIEAEGKLAVDATAKAHELQPQINALDNPRVSSGLRHDLTRQQGEFRQAAEEAARRRNKLVDFGLVTRRNAPRIYSTTWVQQGR